MKTKNLFVMLMALGLSTQALASSFTVECSNPQGTVRTSSGMSEHDLVLTEYSSARGEPEKNEIVLSLRDMKVSELKNTPLFQEIHNNCQNGMAVMSNKAIYYSQVRIENANGSLFAEEIMGVTPDRKAVEAFMVCERFVTNFRPCEATKK